MKKTLIYIVLLMLLAGCNQTTTSNNSSPLNPEDITTTYIKKCVSEQKMVEKDGLIIDISGSFKKNIPPTTEILDQLFKYYESSPGIKELCIVIVGAHNEADRLALRFIDTPVIPIPMVSVDMENPIVEIGTQRIDIEKVQAFNDGIIRASNRRRFAAFSIKVDSLLRHVAKSSDIVCAARHMQVLMSEPGGSDNIERTVIIASDLQNNVHRVHSPIDFATTHIIICNCDTNKACKIVRAQQVTQVESIQSGIQQISLTNKN